MAITGPAVKVEHDDVWVGGNVSPPAGVVLHVSSNCGHLHPSCSFDLYSVTGLVSNMLFTKTSGYATKHTDHTDMCLI